MQFKTVVLLASAFARITVANPLPNADAVAASDAETVAGSLADAMLDSDVDSPLIERANGVRMLSRKESRV